MAAKRSDHLEVAADLILDADYIAGGSLALLGKRGAGKSFATRVLAEELFAAGVQLIMVDPMGVFGGCDPAPTETMRVCPSRCSAASTPTRRWSRLPVG